MVLLLIAILQDIQVEMVPKNLNLQQIFSSASEAITAVNMNAAANGVSIETNCNNLIGQINSDWSTILLGDMFYDEAFRDSLVSWLTKQYAKCRTNIFIGDPGRLPLTNHPVRSRLTRIVQYDLPFICRQENNGLSTGYVWKLNKR